MVLQKKGQLTIFIVIGLIMLAATALLFYFNSVSRDISNEDIATAGELSLDPQEIKSYVESCIEEIAVPILYQVAEQGGRFEVEEGDSISYDRSRYTYACKFGADPARRCVNLLLSRAFMESEITNAMEGASGPLRTCIDLRIYREQGYTVPDPLDFEVNTTIDVASVRVQLFYPLEFTKTSAQGDDSVIEIEDFSRQIQLPLGKLHDLRTKILNAEIKENHFEVDAWYEQYGNDITIEKHKPYPDITYKLTTNVREGREPLQLLFALQGNDVVDLVGLDYPEQNHYRYCYMEKERQCYANVREETCDDWDGESRTSCSSSGLTEFVADGLCEGEACDHCGGLPTGGSYCEYDGITGNGFDLVGSRHYKRTCADGEIYYEECADYREEICVEYEGNGGIPKATCVPNRWQDCYLLDNQNECEDAGFCYWDGSLTKTSSSKTPREYDIDCPYPGNDCWKTDDNYELYDDDPDRPYQERRCVPKVPPGFRFWQNNGQDVCAMAIEMIDSDYTKEDEAWADSTAKYCYHMGDCGAYRNIAQVLTETGFINTHALDPETPINDHIYLMGGRGELFRDQGHRFSHFAGDFFPSSGIDHSEYMYRADNLIPLFTTYDNFLDNMGGFADFALEEYTESNFRDHFLEDLYACFPPTLCPDPHLHYWTRHFSMCLPWQAPLSIEDTEDPFSLLEQREPQEENCDLCNRPNKPCTEYLCRSLGASCVFEMRDDGIGECREPDPAGDDESSPILSIQETDPGIQFIASSISGYDVLDQFQGYRICEGNTPTDCVSTPPTQGIEPYEQVGITLESNKPVRCKVSQFPILNYNSIHPFFVSVFLMGIPQLENTDFGISTSQEFTTEHRIEFVNLPRGELRNALLLNPSLESIFQLASPGGLIARFLAIAENLGDSRIDSTLVEFFQNLLEDLSSNVDTILETFTLAEETMNLMVIRDSQDITTLFMNCVDEYGNQNNNFFIEYYNVPDTTDPQIMETNPTDGAIVEDSSLTYEVFLNEPSECRYSLGSSTAWNVKEKMSCASSQFETTNGWYKCADSFALERGDNIVYLECRDQPIKQNTYAVEIVESNDLFDSFEILEHPSVIVLEEPNTLKVSKYRGRMPVVQVGPGINEVEISLAINVGSACKWSDINEDYFEIEEAHALSCISGESPSCTLRRSVGSEVLYFKCVNADLPEQNTLTTQRHIERK